MKRNLIAIYSKKSKNFLRNFILFLVFKIILNSFFILIISDFDDIVLISLNR